MSSRCVIIGAGHGAAQLCSSLRQGGWEEGITLIGDEPTLPYHRPPLSKTLLDATRNHELTLIRPEAFFEDNGIEVLSATRAERIDRQNKTIIADGREIAYGKLVLATGSLHCRPPVSGVDHPRVFNLRTAEEASRIRDIAAKSSRAVIIGAGFIGLEVAASLRKLGLEVTVLELAPRVLARVTSPEVSNYFARLHRANGVDLRTGVSASAIVESGAELQVQCSDGDTIAGDFVVLGAGAVANASLAADAGLEVDNGVRVNGFNCTSDPDIYAIGDCCNQFHPLYQRNFRLESVQNAMDQAKTVAAALNGNPVAHQALPWFWSDQYDVKIQIAGMSADYDTVVIRGNPDADASFSAWYFKDGRFLAVDAINDSVAYAVGTKLLKAGKQPDPASITDISIETKHILNTTKSQTMNDPRDPFAKARAESGIQHVDCDGEKVPMILRMKDLRKTAKDWKSFSSDLAPKITLHSEADVRSVRQLPIEVDPADPTDYRALVQPLFDRPKNDPEYMDHIQVLVEEMVEAAASESVLEAVRGFALPLQSRALTYLLSMPESEADVWIGWGVHVFHDRDDDVESGHLLESYTGEQFRKAEKNPGEDFFSYLNQVEFRGRKLTFEEKQGFANVTFAGGRDTVINTVSSIFTYLGEHPDALDFLREDETRIVTAVEEFVRYVSPLTATTRKCPHATRVLDQQDVPAGNRVGLCWPSANRDDQVFKTPDQVILDRSPNPHIGFGFGIHNCMGAPHARLIIRSLLKALCDRVDRIELLDAVPKKEVESSFERVVGYESVKVRIMERAKND